jgi:hypothetical protein
MRKVSFILAASLLFAVSGQAAPLESRSVVLRVQAAGGWQDSGLSLKAGQHYAISAWGTWASGTSGTAGPEGKGNGTLTEDALLGMVAINRPRQLSYDSYVKEIVGQIIRIGRGGEFNSPASGKLWLCMGDWSGCKECSGYVEVLIVAYESPK